MGAVKPHSPLVGENKCQRNQTVLVLLHDVQREDVVKDVIDWLRLHVPASR